jgi:hypothetical protein
VLATFVGVLQLEFETLFWAMTIDSPAVDPNPTGYTIKTTKGKGKGVYGLSFPANPRLQIRANLIISLAFYSQKHHIRNESCIALFPDGTRNTW